MKYLYDTHAFSAKNHAPSYWRDTAPELADFPSLTADTKCDVAVIGSGYTGMMAAYRLATKYQIDVKVFEAAQPGWGASGRNGGFCCMGSTKLSYQQMISRYGLEATKDFFAVQKQSVAFVKSFLETHNIDADVTGTGEIELAHKANRVDDLRQEQDFLAQTFDHETHILSPEQLREMGLAGDFHGGLHNPTGFGLHPLKYARGLAKLLRDTGIEIFGNSPVTKWEKHVDGHHLHTPQGIVKANHVIMATNGYTPENLSANAAGKLLPALSSILVTRPLSEQEQQDQGWTNTTTVYDSRILLHYFRLLPDGRFLFGGRGGTDSSATGEKQAEKRVRADFEKLFPAWSHVEHTHFWQGFICLANDLVPYIGPINKDKTAWTSLAYHGNGVAMSGWAGSALADEIAGDRNQSKLPTVFTKRFDKFPLPALRLHYLKAAYAFYQIKDEWL
ncbi:hypothetical protein WH95_10630 [Kiloniella litopenaei]|uniref:FAD dependent oxidoreductase domain-containing protein n=1 Tax=Kiloniella litopenaei TaxID=1549748 RepID=A0A0M2RA51_9PROT|nr:FAD-binding oxidoreductase [Kiloniella litopenaei]KKJ76875.1 hypothetical protein WH95_10630 [Kiloniella litopenaei]